MTQGSLYTGFVVDGHRYSQIGQQYGIKNKAAILLYNVNPMSNFNSCLALYSVSNFI